MISNRAWYALLLAAWLALVLVPAGLVALADGGWEVLSACLDGLARRYLP